MGVVISGLGLVTAYGPGLGAFRHGLLAGHSALAPARRFDAGEFSTDVAAECRYLPATRTGLVRPALAEALTHARITPVPERTLVITVGQGPSPEPGQEPLHTFAGLDGRTLDDLAGAERLTTSHACASVAFGMLLGRDWLLAGLADTVLIAGAVALNRCEYAGMAAVRALSATGVRPFDESRDGTALGEGAGVIVLERAATVRSRGHRPVAALAGGDCRISPSVGAATDQDTVADCMSAALDQAGRRSADLVHAHATGTGQGDAAEVAGLAAVGRDRGWSAVPVDSHKGAVGHLMHAAGFPAVAAAVLALRTGTVAGTVGLSRPMPVPAQIDLVSSARAVPVRTALVNSFGFGGNTAALVLTTEEN